MILCGPRAQRRSITAVRRRRDTLGRFLVDSWPTPPRNSGGHRRYRLALFETDKGGPAMRGKLIAAAALFALGALTGVTVVVTAAPDFVLRGGRFRPLSYDELNPAQKAFADAEIATGRKSFDGPTNIYLRSPEMAKASRPINRYLRFEAPTEHK